MTSKLSQLLDEGCFRVGEEDAFYSAHGAPRMEEVDAQIHVLSLLALTDVLYIRGVT